MSRRREFLLWAPIALATLGRAQAPLPPKESDSLPPPEDQVPLPPPEDKVKNDAEQYAFNPVKSKKAVEIGEFYFKKSDFRAAAGRFTEATKWNNGNAEAWLRLGDAEEKMNDLKAAQAAWKKYLELDPKGKNVTEVRKKIERLSLE